MRFLVFALLLAACHAPSPAMRHAGVQRQEVTVDAARWRVDWDGETAEAHRLNMDTRIVRGPMVMRGAAAIMVVTGCFLRPGTLEGDQAIVRAGTECGGAPARRVLAPGPERIACVLQARREDSRAPEAVLTDCLVQR
jgi:hypothetical protein